MRLIVSRKVSDSELDMSALLNTFEEELTAREREAPNSLDEAKKGHLVLHRHCFLVPEKSRWIPNVAIVSRIIHPLAVRK